METARNPKIAEQVTINGMRNVPVSEFGWAGGLGVEWRVGWTFGVNVNRLHGHLSGESRGGGVNSAVKLEICS